METASGKIADVITLRKLIDEERIKTIIDRTYPLEIIVEAHKYVETGAKQGNVFITMDYHSKI